jgi:hypothetical protein
MAMIRKVSAQLNMAFLLDYFGSRGPNGGMRCVLLGVIGMP